MKYNGKCIESSTRQCQCLQNGCIDYLIHFRLRCDNFTDLGNFCTLRCPCCNPEKALRGRPPHWWPIPEEEEEEEEERIVVTGSSAADLVVLIREEELWWAIVKHPRSKRGTQKISLSLTHTCHTLTLTLTLSTREELWKERKTKMQKNQGSRIIIDGRKQKTKKRCVDSYVCIIFARAKWSIFALYPKKLDSGSIVIQIGQGQ